MAKPSGDPFQDMCTMVGLMTITWTWAENALAIAIGTIDGKVPAMRGHSELPISLKNRLSYLRNALADVPALGPIKQDGTALVKLFIELKERRHKLVHDSTWQMPDGSFAAFHFIIKGRQHTGEHKPVEMAQVVIFNREIEGLNLAAHTFLQNVDRIFNP